MRATSYANCTINRTRNVDRTARHRSTALKRLIFEITDISNGENFTAVTIPVVMVRVFWPMEMIGFRVDFCLSSRGVGLA